MTFDPESHSDYDQATDPTDRYFGEEKKRFPFNMHQLTIGFLLVIALGGIGIYLTQAWFAENRKSDTELASLRIIHANPQPLKMKPTDPGGYVPPDMDKSVYSTLSSQESLPKVERLSPPPEKVMERPKQRDTAKIEIVKQPDSMEGLIDQLELEEQTTPTPSAKPTKLAKAEPGLEPQTKPTIKPKDIEPMPAKKKEQLSSIGKETRTKKKGFTVQLASFKNEKDAESAWTGFQAKHKDLASLSHSVSKKDLGKKGIFYRLYAGNFGNETEARRTCKKLQDKQQSCFVVSLERE